MKMFITLFALSINAFAAEATYFRAWQGFKKTELSESQFLAALPSFMQETVDLYRTNNRVLSNYLVVIPPKNKPSFVPDELALVALHSAEDYQRVRATPEGQNYSARHWDVFDRTTSASATMLDFTALNPSVLEHNKAYDVIGKPVDWAKGFATAYIGLRKTGITSANFLKGLTGHVSLVKRALTSKGLKGYIVIAHENYEVAYMLWDSRTSMERAFAGQAGEVIRKDGEKILTPLMFKPFTSFMPNQSVGEDEALVPVAVNTWED
jgi:hypothetical protein